MKTAVSIPDAVFRKAERLAKRLGKNRSELYAAALREYLLRHGPAAEVAALNATVRRHGQPSDGSWERAASSGIAKYGEW
jgi:metal-responsive CopG/Arc/MetJ family transcriptional regulator